MAVTQAYLNGVPLDFLPWTVSIYRGTEARPFVIQVSNDKASQIAEAIRFKGNQLTVTGAASPGTTGKSSTITVSGLICDRGMVHDLTRSTFTLYDKRFLLERLICPFDFNMKFTSPIFDPTLAFNENVIPRYEEDTAPGETSPATLGFALEKISKFFGESISVSNDKNKEIVLPDFLRTRGMRMNEAIGVIIRDIGLDLTVQFDGRVMIIERASPTDENLGPLLPVTGEGKTFSYRTYPGFASDNHKVSSFPKRIRSPYKIRASIDASVDTTTGAGSVDGFPVIRQVFSYVGRYWTYEQLQKSLSAAITEENIAKDFFSENWINTGLTDSFVFGRFIAAALKDVISRDWRRLFFIDFGENQGTWIDVEIGTLATNGDILPGAVKCNYIQVFDEARASVQQAPIVGNNNFFFTLYEYGENVNIDNGPSPLRAVWENEAMRVIRITDPEPRNSIALRMPGQFIDVPSAVFDTGQIGALASKGLDSALDNSMAMLMREHIRMNSFQPIIVQIVATLDAPNDESVWWIEDVDTKNDKAEGGDVYLEVSDKITANKVNAILSIREALTRPDNIDDISKDAERRANFVLQSYKTRRAGYAETLGPELINATLLGGAMSRIDLVFGANAVNAVSCTVFVEQLFDAETADNIASRRFARASTKAGRGKQINA